MGYRMMDRKCENCGEIFSVPIVHLVRRPCRACSNTCAGALKRSDLSVGSLSYQKNQIERFEKKFSPEPNSGCWLWFGATARMGYGSFCFNGITRTASRISWEIYRGPIPDGMHVLHKCDVPACVNPDHLFLGNRHDNMSDCVRKGRHKIPHHAGEKNKAAKLTDAAVRKIRKSSDSTSTLAKKYGVDYTLIWQVRKRKIWKHVA